MFIYLLIFAGLLFTVFVAVLLLRHRTCPYCQKNATCWCVSMACTKRFAMTVWKRWKKKNTGGIGSCI
ncbi:hypothetical protein ACSPAH_16905 [Buttiauxella agrestis]